jgi:hypothetical protein
MSMIESKVSGISITYEVIWGCCKNQIEVARRKEPGYFYFNLTAMVMAYYTYEAYLNHVLFCIDEETWKNERSFFSTEPYYRTPGKLKKICELIGTEFPDTSRRPYQSIKELQKLRDFIGHGKPEYFEEVIKHKRGENPTYIDSRLTKMVSSKKADRTINDVEEFIKDLNKKVRLKHYHQYILDNPLNGFSGFSTAEEIIKP